MNRPSPIAHTMRSLAFFVALFAALSLAPACFAQGTATPSPPAPQAPPTPAQSPSAAPAPKPADDPAKSKLVVNGLFDIYYMYQFSNPTHLSQNYIGIPNYNVRVNQPTISLAELDIAEAPPATGGSGFKVTLQTGDTPDITHGGLGTDPATYPEARFKNIPQLYGSWLARSGWGTDLGEFFTPFGYEVIQSNANYNYSRSWINTLLIPAYQTGLRVYTPNMKGFVATFYLVRAINDTNEEGVDDDNHQPGYITSFVYSDPRGKFKATETIGYSEDIAILSTVKDNTTLSDTDFTYNLNRTNLIGLNYTYRKDDSPNHPSNQAASTTANGYAAYYRNQFTRRNAVALRYDTVTGSEFDLLRPWDFTATLEDNPSGSFLTRLEYRHDGAKLPTFANGGPNAASKNQDTVSVSEVFTFE